MYCSFAVGTRLSLGMRNLDDFVDATDIYLEINGGYADFSDKC
jgi:hypothetical protein